MAALDSRCRGWIGSLLCIIFLSNVLPIYGQLAEVEQSALLDLINTFNRVPSNWDATNASNACNWPNILCSDDKTTITSIRIFETNLGGYIPTSIGNLTNLSELLLSRVGVTGTVPEELLQLPNLVYLGLEGNFLTGNMSQFAKMPALKQLYVGNNTLHGTIPEFTTNLEALSCFLNRNLTGTLPTWLFQSSSITLINIGITKITGTIPEMNMPNLFSLTLTQMAINGTIPSLEGVPALQELYLNNLQVTGLMPNMTDLNRLTTIDLAVLNIENCFALSTRSLSYCRIARTLLCSDCLPWANCTMVNNNVNCNAGTPSLTAPDGSVISPDGLNNNSELSQEAIIAIAVVIPVVVVGLAVFLIVFFVRRNQKKKQGKKLDRSKSELPEWLKTKTTNPNFELLEKEVMKLPQKLFTPYEQITVKNLLGVGSFGQVFEGEWQKSKVALKISLSQVSDSFIEEIKLVADMRPHPNIVQLLGYSIHPDNLNMILVMEFCNGGSLDIHLFDSNRDLPVAQKLELAKGIALGLNHLHANGIVHRDIAARNILLSNGVPKLSDFGMSRQLDGGKKRGTTKADTGPVRWMAPESLKDQEYSTQSDVWMFGVLMFEVFAQSEPHADEDPLDVGIKIRNEGYTPQMTANIPTEVADIMKRCWNIDPEQRPSMAEVVSLIKNLEQ